MLLSNVCFDPPLHSLHFIFILSFISDPTMHLIVSGIFFLFVLDNFSSYILMISVYPSFCLIYCLYQRDIHCFLSFSFSEVFQTFFAYFYTRNRRSNYIFLVWIYYIVSHNCGTFSQLYYISTITFIKSKSSMRKVKKKHSS